MKTDSRIHQPAKKKKKGKTNEILFAHKFNFEMNISKKRKRGGAFFFFFVCVCGFFFFESIRTAFTYYQRLTQKHGLDSFPVPTLHQSQCCFELVNVFFCQSLMDIRRGHTGNNTGVSQRSHFQYRSRGTCTGFSKGLSTVMLLLASVPSCY